MSGHPVEEAPGATSRLRLLLGLRVRMMFRSRMGRGRGAILAVGVLVSVGISLFAGTIVWGVTSDLASRGEWRLVSEWTHLVFFFAYLMLVLVPVLGFSSNEFFDITRLFHLPVSHRTVFTAQTIGLSASGTVLFMLPALLAVVVPTSRSATLVLRLALLLLFVFHAVALSQMLQLLLLNTLRSRRFRDLAAVVAALFMAFSFLSFRFLVEAGDPQAQVVRILSGGYSRYLLPVPCRWVSGCLAPGVTLSLAVALSGATIAVTWLTVLLAASLQRKAFQGLVPPARIRAAASPGTLRRTGRLLRRIPGDIRALVGREYSMLRREPAVKTLLIHQSVFVILPTLLWMLGVWGHRPGSAATLVTWGGYLLLVVESNLCFNLLGLEGPGIRQLFLTPVPRERILAGKVLAYFSLFAAANLLLVATVAGVSAATGRGVPARTVTGALFAVPGALGVLLGVGAVVSAIFPGRLTAQGRRALSQSSAGHGGCLLTIAWLLALGCAALLMVPVHLLAGEPALCPLAPVYGAVVLLLGLRVGGSAIRHREDGILSDLMSTG